MKDEHLIAIKSKDKEVQMTFPDMAALYRAIVLLGHLAFVCKTFEELHTALTQAAKQKEQHGNESV